MSAFVAHLQEAFVRHADAEKAVGMEQYMRNLFTFHGIMATPRRELLASALRVHGRPDNVLAIASELYSLPQREYHHSACDLLVWAAGRTLGVADLPAIEKLICTNSWWDTVDSLAPRVAGGILKEAPPAVIRAQCERWIASDVRWLQRSAIILQLHWKKRTHDSILFDMILARADSREFFVQKGAGWALREYSKVNPEGVREFIRDHAHVLSALTKREGRKRL